MPDIYFPPSFLSGFEPHLYPPSAGFKLEDILLAGF